MAATTTNYITVTLGYSNTNFQRKYKITDVDDTALENVKTKIRAYNAAIPAADKKVFISDDYDDTDSENIVGEFNGIIAAKSVTEEEEDINLNV